VESVDEFYSSEEEEDNNGNGILGYVVKIRADSNRLIPLALFPPVLDSSLLRNPSGSEEQERKFFLNHPGNFYVSVQFGFPSPEKGAPGKEEHRKSQLDGSVVASNLEEPNFSFEWFSRTGRDLEIEIGVEKERESKEEEKTLSSEIPGASWFDSSKSQAFGIVAVRKQLSLVNLARDFLIRSPDPEEEDPPSPTFPTLSHQQ